jgi:Helix-turn-helix domain
LSSVLNRSEGRIEEIERETTAVAPLIDERARLLRARALILGEPEPEPLRSVRSPSRRVTRAAVFEHLARNPGSSAGEIAAALGISQGATSAHLHRGKGRWFASRGGRWYPVAESAPAAAS